MITYLYSGEFAGVTIVFARLTWMDGWRRTIEIFYSVLFNWHEIHSFIFWHEYFLGMAITSMFACQTHLFPCFTLLPLHSLLLLDFWNIDYGSKDFTVASALLRLRLPMSGGGVTYQGRYTANVSPVQPWYIPKMANGLKARALRITVHCITVKLLFF